MSISCSCPGDYEWFYIVEDFERSSCAEGVCYGCGELIHISNEVRRIYQYELDDDGWETENQILGRLCPECSSIYDSLIELGFCLSAYPGFIKEALKQYQEGDY